MRFNLLLALLLSLTIVSACGKGVRPEARDSVRFSALETDAVESQVIQDPGPQANAEQLNTYKPIVQGVRDNRDDLFNRADVGGQLERIEGVFIATGEYLELVAYYQEAVEEKGADSAVGRRLAWGLIRLGQQKAARDLIDDLLEKSPDDALVHFLVGAFYLQNERSSVEDRKKAIDAWTRVLERDSGFRGYEGITAGMVKNQIDRMTASIPPEERDEEPPAVEALAAAAANGVIQKVNEPEVPELKPAVAEGSEEPVAEGSEEPVAEVPDPTEADSGRQYKILVARGEMALAQSKFEEAETLFLQAKQIRPDGFSAELGQLEAGWGVESARNTIETRARTLAKRQLDGDQALRLGRFVWTRMNEGELARKLLEDAKKKAPGRAKAADALLEKIP